MPMPVPTRRAKPAVAVDVHQVPAAIEKNDKGKPGGVAIAVLVSRSKSAVIDFAKHRLQPGAVSHTAALLSLAGLAIQSTRIALRNTAMNLSIVSTGDSESHRFRTASCACASSNFRSRCVEHEPNKDPWLQIHPPRTLIHFWTLNKVLNQWRIIYPERTGDW